MKGLIPEDKIAEVLHSASIVEVISDYVSLAKVGRNYTGLCPFHSEKTPSFTVSAEKQIFYCFGCGVGGNVFSFLMRYHNISFPEAVSDLAKRYGVIISTQRMSPEEKRRFQQKDHILGINRQASEYFHNFLAVAPEGKSGRQYLEKRGLSQEVIERFAIGYVDGSWNRLLRFFSEKKVSSGLVERAGLIVKKSQGYYDRFRSRIIFPIFDVRKKIIGFGGRLLDNGLPKYLNSPDTPVYDKSRSLYGIHVARSSCRSSGSVFVVEGYFDLLALSCHDIHNCVATLGTSLTREHVRMLKGLAGTAILVFDSDNAGIKAAQRSLPLFAEEKMDVRILILPDGHDPDTFVFQQGREAFLKLSGESLGSISFLISYFIAKYGVSIDGKARIVDALKISIGALSDGVKRSLYIRELSERLNIEESVVLEQIRKATSRNYGKITTINRKGGIVNDHHLEKGILQMMVQNPSILSAVIEEGIVAEFENPVLKNIGQLILQLFQDTSDVTVADIIAGIDDPEYRSLMSSLFLDEQAWERQNCLRRIEQFRHAVDKRKARLLSQRIKEAQEANDQELLSDLLREKNHKTRSSYARKRLEGF
ncbi:MAG: DNA primase [Desulfobacteria bacterium]